MIRYFEKKSTESTRALQIWQILISKAHNRQSMTCGELADLLKYNGAGVMNRMLGHISWYCDENDLPPLTALVVNKTTGIPGEGLHTLISLKKLNVDRERVYDYAWYAIFPPSPAELVTVFKRNIGV